VTSKIDVIYVF